jgi:hypothetical protein
VSPSSIASPDAGAALCRRQFDLPEDDREYLDTTGLSWETIVEGPAQWLLLHNFVLPVGYTVECATAALRISPGYPTAQLDMVYFHPALARRDGRPVGALTLISLDGRTYQQWSRHRTPLNPWRAGLDSVATHLSLVEDWLRREFGARSS